MLDKPLSVQRLMSYYRNLEHSAKSLIDSVSWLRKFQRYVLKVY